MDLYTYRSNARVFSFRGVRHEQCVLYCLWRFVDGVDCSTLRNSNLFHLEEVLGVLLNTGTKPTNIS